AQRVWADALRDEFNAIYQYNSSIATYEYAKGTILTHDNVVISEGPLPHCAQVRAVEHERERTKALVLLERAQPVNHGAFEGHEATIPGVPDLPAPTTPSVPSLYQNLPTTPAPAEPLPLPGSGTQGTMPAASAAARIGRPSSN